MASVGHLYGFGNTLDKALTAVVGCKERGRQVDGPLDHSTGKGMGQRPCVWRRMGREEWVKEVDGGAVPNTVLSFTHTLRVVETLGYMSEHGAGLSLPALLDLPALLLLGTAAYTRPHRAAS